MIPFYTLFLSVGLFLLLLIIVGGGILLAIGMVVRLFRRSPSVAPAVRPVPLASASAGATPASTLVVPALAPAPASAPGVPFGTVPMPPLRQLSKRERNAILMESARRQDKIAGRS